MTILIIMFPLRHWRRLGGLGMTVMTLNMVSSGVKNSGGDGSGGEKDLRSLASLAPDDIDAPVQML